MKTEIQNNLNQSLLEKLKNQASILGSLRFEDGEDVKFLDWANKTKLIILFLSFDKKDEYLRKELIAMFEKCIYKMKINHSFILRVIQIKKEIQSLVQSFTEILELRENNLGDEENKEQKKSSKK